MRILTYVGVVVYFCLVKGQLDLSEKHEEWLKLNALACAIKPRPHQRSIIRDAVKLGEFPFVVRIYFQEPSLILDPDSVVKTCMGTILSHRHVITSSSCFLGLDPDVIDQLSMWVRAGEIDINKNPDCISEGVCGEEYKEYDIEHVQFFRDNSPADQGQNLAIVTTKHVIEFSAGFISPVCLEHGHHLEKDHSGGKGYRLAGWGKDPDREGGILYKVLVYIFTEKENHKVYNQMPDSFKANEDSEAFFAVGVCGLESHQYEESGGPFLVEDTPEGGDKRMYLYGVFSFEATDVQTDHGPPGIYTKIRPYLPWILGIVDPHLEDR